VFLVNGVRVWARPVLLAAMIALVLGLAACGDSDDGGDGGGATAASNQNESDGGNDNSSSSGDTNDVAGGGSDEEQVRAVVANVQKAIVDKDSEFICENLTAESRKAATERSQRKSPNGTCVENFDEIASARVKGAPFPKVTKVTVKGDKATVKLSEGRYKQDLPVYKEGGKWKVHFTGAEQADPDN